MTYITTRFFLSLGNVFISLILGAVALFACWFYLPDLTAAIFRYAGSFREWILNQGFSSSYEVAVRAFLDDRQIVYMGFVLVARTIVGLLIAGGYWLISRLFGAKDSPAITKA